MIKSLILYPSWFDTHSSMMDEIEDRLTDMELHHYASCLLEKGLNDETELELALQKAVTALGAVHLPATKHFKKVYICVGGELKTDWLVSDLALGLIMMNADVANPAVAKLQIRILTSKTEDDGNIQ
jgi:hypothetical protein